MSSDQRINVNFQSVGKRDDHAAKQPLEIAKRWGIDNAIWETIPRTGKLCGVGCVPPERTETTMTYLVMVIVNLAFVQLAVPAFIAFY